MRFVFTAPRFHTNQRYAFKALLDAGHEVTVLALRRGRSEAYDVLEPRVLGTSRVFNFLRRAASALPGMHWSDVGGMPPVLTLWREIRRLKPDAVVVRNPSSAYGLLATLMVRLAGAQLVFYSQTPRFRRVSRARQTLEKLFLGLAGSRWFSPVLGDAERNILPRDSPAYVPFVMEPQSSPASRRWFSEGQVNILHVGKFEPRKHHDMFLEVVARLLRRHFLHATIVGECSTEAHCTELTAIKQLRERLGLSDAVSIETNVPYLDMGMRYSGHDLFVLASRDEPAAFSLLEAMAHSLPVVCSDSNGTRCYVQGGSNGYVFRSGDLDDMAMQVERVIEDRGRMVDMGRCSYEIVRTEHAPGRYVDALVGMAVYTR